MSHATAFWCIAAITLYGIVMMLLRERQPAVHLIPIALTTLQATIVLVTTWLHGLASGAHGLNADDYQVLVVAALLPVSFLQMLLASIRKPHLIKIPYYRALMIFLLAQMALVQVVGLYDVPSVPKVVAFALAIATAVSAFLIVTGRIGPSKLAPTTKVFD